MNDRVFILMNEIGSKSGESLTNDYELLEWEGEKDGGTYYLCVVISFFIDLVGSGLKCGGIWKVGLSEV